MKLTIDLHEMMEQMEQKFSIIIEKKLNEFEKRLAAMLPASEAKYHTISEVAKITKFERATVYKWINSKKLPVCEIGTKRRVKDSDLTLFLKSPAYELKIKKSLTRKM